MSKAAEDISYTDIEEILKISRRNNDRDDVTGLLIFHDGYFLQLLEGAEKEVRNTLHKIIDDDRNYSVKVLTETQSGERLFEDWSMAFFDGDISCEITPDLENLFGQCKMVTVRHRFDAMPFFKKVQASSLNLK